MKVELLYPEITGLYGDLYNIEYLRRSVPGCGIASTSLGEKPRFLDDPSIDLVYMGSMTEKSQTMVLDELMPHREDIWISINRDQNFLITGNAIELFGSHITETGDMALAEVGGDKIETLGIFDFNVERNSKNKFNTEFLGEYVLPGNDAIQVVGFQSRSSQGFYGPNAPDPLFNVTTGMGFSKGDKREGIHYKNFMGTFTAGPLLVLNPAFLVRLCWEMGYAGIVPAHMEASMNAYRKRLYEYSEKKRENRDEDQQDSN